MPSNVENILNAILTGDGSGIQKPASRVEELLFEIYEQGGGGGDSVIGGIKLTIDSNYIMTATLVDKDGEEYGVSDDIDLPLETMVVDGEYDSQTQKIKLELKNGNYVEFSVADLVSGLQTELSSSNKLNPTYIDYDSTHRAVSDSEKNTWNAKQNAISDLDTIRSGAAAGATAVQPSEMQTALATKQDSLSETQLAAANSGINSTKVAQIDTNQTNIWYTINNGMANALVIPDQTQTSGSLTLTIQDGVARIKGTSASQSQSTKFVVADHINLKAGTYYLSGGNGGTFGENFIRLGKQSGDTYIVANADNTKSVFTLAEDTECQFTIWARGTNLNLTFYPMISLFSDIDFKKTLPNHELTKLESEDRSNMLLLEKMNGAKNYIDSKTKSQTITTGGANITVTVNPDKSFEIIGTTGNSDVFITICKETDFVLPAGDYVFSGLLSGAGSGLYLYMAQGSSYVHITSGSYPTAEFSINSNQAYTVAIHLEPNKSYPTPQKIYPMICDKLAWDNGLTQYMPFALPNTDLTVLEAEDRAALAEVVDEGAKNKFDFASLSNPTLNNATVTKTDSSIVVTSSGSYARAVYSFDLNAGTYKLRLSASDITNESGSDTGMFVGLYKSSTITLNNELCRIYCTTAGVKDVEFNHAGGTVYVVFYINGSSTSYTNTYTISQMMICTEADWKISPKFVPHRPCYDLVAAFAQNGGFIDSTLGSIIANADLNSINKTTFAVYNEPANLPSGITGYCYVRTSVFDENSALQELYVIQPNPVSFFRIKLNNSWTVWVQTSNV